MDKNKNPSRKRIRRAPNKKKFKTFTNWWKKKLAISDKGSWYNQSTLWKDPDTEKRQKIILPERKYEWGWESSLCNCFRKTTIKRSNKCRLKLWLLLKHKRLVWKGRSNCSSISESTGKIVDVVDKTLSCPHCKKMQIKRANNELSGLYYMKWKVEHEMNCKMNHTVNSSVRIYIFYVFFFFHFKFYKWIFCKYHLI